MKSTLLACLLAAASVTVAAQGLRPFEMVVQSGRPFVNAASLTPDGGHVFTGNGDGTVRVWDVATGRLISALPAGRDVLDVAISPDGKELATVGSGGYLDLWDTATFRRRPLFFSADYSFRTVAWSPDGKVIVTGGRDRAVRLWDVASGRQLAVNRHGENLVSVEFSRDGRQLLTVAEDYSARVWRVTGSAGSTRFDGPATLVINRSRVQHAVFLPDGRRIIVAYFDGDIELWDIAAGQVVRVIEKSGGGLRDVAVSGDGRFMAGIPWRGGDTKLWDTSSWEVVRAVNSRIFPTQVAFSADGSRLLFNSVDRSALLNLTGDPADALVVIGGESAAVDAGAISANGRHLFTGSRDGVAILWDLQDGAAKVIYRSELRGLYDAIRNVGFIDNGQQVATVMRDGSVRSFAIATGELTGLFKIYEYAQTAFTPDGGLMTASRLSQAFDIWDTRTKQVVGTSQSPDKTPTWKAMALSPDAQHAVIDGGDAYVWNLAEQRAINRFPRISSAAFAPDGRTLIVAAGGAAAILDPIADKVVHLLRAEGTYFASYSPDGRFALTAGEDGARVWDASKGTLLRQLPVAGAVSAVMLHSERLAVTIGRDGTTRLWDVPAGRELLSLVSLTSGAWVTVTPQGHFDASDPDQVEGVHWVRDAEIVLPSQLNTKRYYVPGLLSVVACPYMLELPGTCPVLPAVENLRQLALPPAIAVTAPTAGSQIARVTMTDRGGGVGQLRIRVNGRDITAAPALAQQRGAERHYVVDLGASSLDINGVNRIEASAYNAENSVRGRAASATWTTTPASAQPQSLWGIVVGVSSYADPSLRLAYSAKDAVQVADAIRIGSSRLLGADRTHVSALTDRAGAPVTKSMVYAAFAEVAQRAAADDIVFVYFAGHAVAWKDVYYYLTSDARGTDVGADEGLRNSATISSDDLAEWLVLKGMPRKVVVVLDTCAAGAAGNELSRIADRRELSADHKRALQILREVSDSYHFLMGSAADRVSYEAGRYGQGLLTYALLMGMRGAALETDGRIDVRKLFDFAQDNVPELARGIGGVQRPEIRSPKGASFPLGRLNDEDRARIRVASPKPVLIQVLCSDEDQLDVLGLRNRIRADLREASYPRERGGIETDPRLVYLDNVTDAFQDALSPRIQYRVDGGRVAVRIRLVRDEAVVRERSLTVDQADLSRAVVEQLIAMAEEIG